MKTGSVYVKENSILHISGALVGNNYFFGKDYLVEFVEAVPKN